MKTTTLLVALTIASGTSFSANAGNPARQHSRAGTMAMTQRLTQVHTTLQKLAPAAAAQLRTLTARVRSLVARTRDALRQAPAASGGQVNVRVNNLANLEASLNIIANGMEILGIAWGGPTMIMGFTSKPSPARDAMKKVLFGAAGVTGGLATPGVINWLVASARDANLFSKTSATLRRWESQLAKPNAPSFARGVRQLLSGVAKQRLARVGWEVGVGY